MTETISLPRTPELPLNMKSPEEFMLRKLSGDVQADGVSPELLQDAYRLARSLGDGVLVDAADTGHWDNPALNMLGRSTLPAHPKHFALDASKAHSTGSHDQFSKTLTINPENTVGQKFPNKLWLPDVSPEDAAVIYLMKTMGHEAGHAILSGLAYSDASDAHYLAASKAYMIKHPEHGFTGNLDTDVSIQEERFAEGYGRQVTDQTMKLLGYNKQQRVRVLNQLRHRVDVTGDAGHNQIDQLGSTTPSERLDELVQKAGGDDKSQIRGYLGYAKPLNKRQMVHMMRFFQGEIIDGDGLTTDADPNHWHQQSTKLRTGPVKRHMRYLEWNRAFEREPVKAMTRNLGALMLVLTVGLGAEAGYKEPGRLKQIEYAKQVAEQIAYERNDATVQPQPTDTTIVSNGTKNHKNH